MSVSLIIVNYRSSEETRMAIRTARSATVRDLEVVVVDNSTEAPEAGRLSDAGADRVLISDANLGYGGGINFGLAQASGEYVVMSNPDVRYAPRSIDLLVDALESGAMVAGPAFTWDEQGEWLLPPADLRGVAFKSGQVLAANSAVLARLRDRVRTRRRFDFWRAEDPLRVDTLSGAVMAMRRADLDALGGFDPRFYLYFEETDLMRRVARRRGRIVYVPAARCRHLHDQSFARNPDARSAFAASEWEYLQKWGGESIVRFVARWGGETRLTFPFTATAGEAAVTVPPRTSMLELSPVASFDTAAGRMFSGREFSVPGEIWDAFDGDVLYARAVDTERFRPLQQWALQRERPRSRE